MILASNTQQHKEKHPKKRREKIKQTCRKGRKQKNLVLRFTAAWETQQM
jgi:hypothetical protein